MYATRHVTDSIVWVGASDRRLSMFEGVYSVPTGVSYNSYLILDDMTVLVDTVDKAVGAQFFENLEHALDGRDLNFVVVQHMEPDHSATLLDVLRRYPDAVVVCPERTVGMIRQFFGVDVTERAYVVDEEKTLVCGRHALSFHMAPMVHWPEVMVTFDRTDGVLFSADAFGCFGALGGALFADEVDFRRDYLDEARRYYTNIVGKYGAQTQALLKKAAALPIRTICPLHGFVWRKDLPYYIEKYDRWSRYEPEDAGVMIAYASVYGDTASAADLLATMLRDAGVRTEVFDVSVTPASEIIAASFRWSTLVFASTTYNGGIFISMEELLRDIAAHSLQNRDIAIVENGSWAPTSGRKMKEILGALPDIRFIGETVSIRSSGNEDTRAGLASLAQALLAVLPASALPAPEVKQAAYAPVPEGNTDPKSLFSLTYGLFVLTARDGDRDTGCIINTAMQLTTAPCRISIAVNKANHTHDLIRKNGYFNVNVLTESAPFDLFTRFGFSSGRDTDKFAGFSDYRPSANGCAALTMHTNAFYSGRVVSAIDCGTHTLFIADVTEAETMSREPSVTYAYYFAHIKPAPAPAPAPENGKKRYVCRICGYVYEGDELPDDIICPICKHGKEDFELME